MKPNDKITISLELDEQLTMKVKDALGLDEDEVVPRLGSPRWNNLIRGLRLEFLDKIKLSVEYENPAFDRFPGTVPAFPDHEPDETVHWELPANG